MSQSYIASVNPARRAKQLVVPTPQRTILPQPLLPDQPLTLSHPTSPISDSGSEFEPNAAPPPPPGPAKRGRKPGPLSRAARETQRKLNHSIIEKARRTKINDALASLRALVPSGYGVPKDPEVEEEQGDVAAGKKGKGKKDDKEKEFKLEILERTVVYLNDLIKRVEVLERNAGPSPGDATNTSICNKCSTSSNALKRKRAESTAISEYNRDSPRLPPISSWLLQSQSQADAQIDPQLLTSPSAAVPIGGLPSPPASTHFTPQHPESIREYFSVLVTKILLSIQEKPPYTTKLYSFVLLAGLVATVVEAAPMSGIEEGSVLLSVRAVQAKATCHANRKAAAAKGATGKGATGKAATTKKAAPHGVSKPVRRDGELNELYPRTRPSPSGKVNLYHGTTEDRAKDFEHFDITKAPKSGDFHFDKNGFYMTEQLDHALEYACKSWCLTPDETAVVIKFEWEGSTNTHQFHEQDQKWKDYQKWTKDGSEGNHQAHAEFDKIHNSDMVAGPMRSEGDILNGISEDFYQYVLTNPDAAHKLKMVGKEPHKCGKHGYTG
ncbi:hypothetical protein H0H93_005331 [Arthromyces matolae]|nr:hypothetical protein H0H93_005331 [Arthromyces matolae]